MVHTHVCEGRVLICTTTSVNPSFLQVVEKHRNQTLLALCFPDGAKHRYSSSRLMPK